MIPGVFRLYRRHKTDCPHADRGENYTLCKCPIYADGMLGRRRFRRSMKTGDMPRAERYLEYLLTDGAEVPAGVSVSAAAEAWIADCRSVGHSAATVASYESTISAFLEFAEGPVAGLRLEAITAFRQRKALSPGTHRKELKHLRAFLAFCVQHRWTAENVALRAQMPKDDFAPTLPYTDAEVKAIVAAVDRFGWADTREFSRDRARAIVLLLLYTGIRISDAAKLERRRISGRRFKVRAQKNNADIFIPIPAELADALEALPSAGPRYFGDAMPQTLVGKMRRIIRRLGELAGVHAHPHRFRDTFACKMLESGVDIRTVSLMLGHKSVSTTEKHYAHFVKSHQALLDRAAATLKY